MEGVTRTKAAFRLVPVPRFLGGVLYLFSKASYKGTRLAAVKRKQNTQDPSAEGLALSTVWREGVP